MYVRKRTKDVKKPAIKVFIICILKLFTRKNCHSIMRWYNTFVLINFLFKAAIENQKNLKKSSN